MTQQRTNDAIASQLATDRAERALLDALRSKDPSKIAEATVRYAITQPETIDGIRLALRFAPVLARHAKALQKLPPRLRRAKLQILWDNHIERMSEVTMRARKVAIDAAMKVLAEKPQVKEK